MLDVVKAFEKASGVKINYKIAPRRPGDIAECYADATKAKEELGWEAKYTLDDMCRDSWNFTKNRNNETIHSSVGYAAEVRGVPFLLQWAVKQ